MKSAVMMSFLCVLMTSFAANPSITTPPAGAGLDARTRMRESTEKFRTEQMALYKKLQAARGELEQSAQAAKADEKIIREKAAVIGEIEGDLAVLRSKHYQALRAILPEGMATNHVVLGTNLYSSRLNSLVRVPVKTNAP
jgi:hypothetical protein